MSQFLAVLCSVNRSTEDDKYTRHLLQLEENFDSCGTLTWMANSWTVCFPLIIIYLVAIFVGQEYMRSRPPFQLRGALVLWNIALATYSIISAWRTITANIYAAQKYGLWVQFCSVGNFEHVQSMGVWLTMFTFSKIIEFGDTAFIVLRKSPLRVLHWYHHISVLFFVWSSCAYPTPVQALFCSVNVTVHSFMYSYFALKALRFHIPKFISMAITSLQVIQMAIGVLLTSASYYVKSKYPSCMVVDQALYIAAIIYLSYLVLFLNFFIKSYITPKRFVGSVIENDKKSM